MEAKCNCKQYGPGGGIETLDYLCILLFNNLNRYIYFVISIWLYLICFVNVGYFSNELLKYISRRYNQSTEICQLDCGIRFILYIIRKNISLNQYLKILEEIKKEESEDSELLKSDETSH